MLLNTNKPGGFFLRVAWVSQVGEERGCDLLRGHVLLPDYSLCVSLGLLESPLVGLRGGWGARILKHFLYYHGY